MTEYLPCNIVHVSKGDWRGYIERLDIHVSGSTADKVRYEAYREVEEAFGLRGFVLVFSEI